MARLITSHDFTVRKVVGRVNYPTASVYYQPSVLDEFMFTVVGVDGDVELKALDRDICVLFNQKRINSRSLEAAVNEILSNVRQGSLSDKFSNLSDDELISCIKSRYVQAPSELLNWSEYLESQLTAMDAAAADAVNQQQQQIEVPQSQPASE